MLFSLTPHPAFPAPEPCQVGVHIGWHQAGLLLDYRVTMNTAQLLLPPPAPPVQTDELWRQTCMEIFIKPAGDTAYYEFNFAPSSAWAAYAFTDCRTGMRAHSIPAPTISQTMTPDYYHMQVRLTAPSADLVDCNVCAVLATSDGARSFWALAHPNEKPDFHHPQAFVGRLPQKP